MRPETKSGKRKRGEDVCSPELLRYPEFSPCAPDPKSIGRKQHRAAKKGSWYRDKEVEIKSPVVITRMLDYSNLQ